MPRWVKLSEAIAEDLTIADMLGNAAEARAALLFLMALPRADLYGVLPGHPRLFKARVCPVARIGEAMIEKAIALLVERGMFSRFDSEGEAYLLVTNYHKYQEVRWSNYVGPPQVMLPAEWEPPAKLVKWLLTLEPEKQVPFIEKIPWLLQTTTVELPRATVELLTSTGKDVDVDVDVDVDIDKETALVPSATADNTPAKELKAETAKQRKARKVQEEQQLLAEFDEEERELIDDYMTSADEALERKWLAEHPDKTSDDYTGGTTVGGRVSKLAALIAVANEVDDPDAFRYGLHQANQARAANPNYVKKAALSRRDRQ